MADPESRVVAENGLAHYRSVLDKMSPELREAFLNDSLSAGVSKDDAIHTVLALVAELLSKATDKQTELITSALEGALSAKKAENKRLTLLLDACRASLKEAADTVTKASTASAEQFNALNEKIDALERLILQVQRNENAAREKQDEHFQTETAATRKAAADLRDWRLNNLMATFGIVVAITVALTWVFLHWFWAIP